MQSSSTWHFRFFLSLLSLSFGLFLASSTPPALIAASAQIDGLVLEQLAAQGTARVLILLAETTAPMADVQSAQIAQTQASVLAALPAADFQLFYRYQSTPALAGVVTAAGLDILRNQPAVRAVQFDQPGGAHLDRSVPALGADIVHTTYGFTGQGVTVAVLDTGIDTDHPDLAGSIVGQHCFLSDNLCQPGNLAENDNAEDENGHGSHVAGIVTSDGVVAGKGFAPDANIVAVRMLDALGRGYVADWVAGLDWIYANLATQPVQIINMSLGTDLLYSSNCDAEQGVLTDVINQLHAAGVTIFASSGNQGSGSSLAAPACNTNVIAVGATYDGDNGREPDSGSYSNFGNGWPNCVDNPTSLQKITCFTNSNALLDVVAPGAPIESTVIGGGVATYWGTSQASPTAAGVAALLLDADPSLTPAAIENTLKTTGQLVLDPKNNRQFPLINARNAILSLLPTPPTTLTLTAPLSGVTGVSTTFLAAVGPFSAAQPITYVWQASDQPVITHTGGLSDSVMFAWPTPGPQTVQVKAINAGGMVSTTHLITVEAKALTGVAIAGPTVGSTGVTQTLTATSSPLSASQPITYVWQIGGQPPITHTNGIIDPLDLLWTEPGIRPITVTASNAVSTVTATHQISIALVAPVSVSITGPLTDATNLPVSFLANVQPISVSLPITYVWQATAQATVTHTHAITDSVQFTWSAIGPVTLTLTATNRAGVVTDSHLVALVEEQRIYLPLIQR